MKRVLALMLSLTLVLGMLSGCSSSGSKSTPEGGKTKVTMGVSVSLESVGPFNVVTTVLKQVYAIAYMQLANLSPTGELVPNMFDMENLKRDGDHFTVTIYDDIYDSNGNNITAEDVAFSYNTAQAKGVNRAYNYFDTFVATDTYTVEFNMLTRALGAWQNVLSVGNIVSKAEFEASPDEMNTAPVSCSAYKITSFVPGSSVTFEKVDDFWCKDMSKLSQDKQANVDVIELKCITEAAQLPMALEDGSIDLAVNVPGISAKRFEGNSNFAISTMSSNLHWNIFFDEREGHIMNNEDLRKAIAYAIDRDAIMQGATQGFGAVNNTFGCRYAGDYDSAWDADPFTTQNLDKAADALAAAGYNPGDLTIRILCQWEDGKAACEVIKSNLEQIGINSEITVADTALFGSYQDCESNVWDIVVMFYASSTWTAGNYNTALNLETRTNGQTFFGLKDDALQELVMTAITEETTGKEATQAVHQYLKDHTILIPLYSAMNYYVYTPQITELYINADGQVIPNACTYSPDYNIFAE